MPFIAFFFRLCQWEERLWLSFGCPPVISTPANAFTIFRAKLSLYVAPTLYVVYRLSDEDAFLYVALAIIAGCALFDWVDGFIARYFNCTSKSGECLDPAADAINVFVGFGIVLSEYDFALGLFVPVVGIVLIGIGIFAIRIMSGVETHWLARIAIVLIYVGGGALFAGTVADSVDEHTPWRGPVFVFGTVMGFGLFWVGLGLMIASAMRYAYVALPSLKKNMVGTAL